MVDAAVTSYEEQNFTDLMVAFGCTGGQHRSVYFAEELAKHLKGRKKVNIIVNHTNLQST